MCVKPLTGLPGGSIAVLVVSWEITQRISQRVFACDAAHMHISFVLRHVT